MSSTTVKGTVKDFFVYLGLALVLYASLSTLTFLCFNYIDLSLAQSGQDSYQSYRLVSIRWEVSLLIILFPLLLGLTYLTNKDIQRDSTKLEIRSRKWLLYSVMFVTSASGVIDLVYLVYSFLGGDLAKEFLLKLLTVLLIAGVAFAYYYQELQRKVAVSAVSAGTKVLGGLTSFGVVAVLIFGFYTVGLPATQRLHKQDEQRLEDLYWIKNRTESYFYTKSVLPRNLEDLLQGSGLDHLPRDPDTHELYEYRVVSPNSFEVCAHFKTERMVGEPPAYDNWGYHPGRNCFSSQVEQAAK